MISQINEVLIQGKQHFVNLRDIIDFFVVQEIYDITQINEVLFALDQPLLGGRSF